MCRGLSALIAMRRFPEPQPAFGISECAVYDLLLRGCLFFAFKSGRDFVGESSGSGQSRSRRFSCRRAWRDGFIGIGLDLRARCPRNALSIRMGALAKDHVGGGGVLIVVGAERVHRLARRISLLSCTALNTPCAAAVHVLHDDIGVLVDKGKRLLFRLRPRRPNCQYMRAAAL